PRCTQSHLSFHPPPTPPLYPLSLHDALPIYPSPLFGRPFAFLLDGWFPSPPLPDPCTEYSSAPGLQARRPCGPKEGGVFRSIFRSEEHTSELQSRENLVCRLLLEKKKTDTYF